ncbi:hydrophobic/amphiphilic exporter-1, HAE1 family [Fictibacillus enclensis]|uniref:Swarming motility protein SwrC n=1 Tax=Fictibacillus enclensis TaxID=1017270 RepID=A0A0V8J895_9BACL|nr:efflux RND transporter permease subunit [Fictibacillus enclensis]KSU83245.1 Swarming motility protein SwrC [Fictibacillus enclensis]SCC12407.1 hydrophobic/amphiphilic exporter-1, HAE1 family [Fictibacillus enclensis]
MSAIIRFCLKNKFAVWLLTLLVVAAGLYSGLNMKLETMPNINTPIVSVSAAYPGATPEEVADKVTIPIEKKIKNLSGVNSVTSSSYQNVSSVQIEYSFDKDMEKAKEEVQEALANINLPDSVDDPNVSRQSFNDLPILSLSVSDKDKSLKELTKVVEDDVVPTLEGVEGVSSVQVAGQNVEELQLDFKDDELKKNGLTEDSVKQFIKGANSSMPLGLYNFNNTEKSVVVDGNITTVKELKNLEIPVTPQASGEGSQGAGASAGQGAQQQSGGQGAQQQSGGQGASLQAAANQQAQPTELPTVKLKDVATIKTVGKAESISRTNGQESIGLQVIKSADANTVNVADAVNKELKQLKKEHEGLKTVNVFDQATPIKDSVSTMLNKALIGGLFAIIIILLFLRNFRSTIIAVISIPLSLLMAILALKQMDITLNIMTLGAMTVAIGRVVDDSIVVIENIYRRMSLKGEGIRGKQLITAATREMFIPIMSSTIVTIAVFLPLGLVKGPVGELFMPFALTIVFALVASLIVAITVVPAFADSLFKKGLSKKKEVDNEKPGALAGFYKRVLNWSLSHKIVSFGLAILLLAGSLFLVPKIGVSFLPSDEQKMVIATFNPEPGQTKKEVEVEALKAEKLLLDRNHVKTIQYSVGGENPMNPAASNQAMFFMEYDKDTPNFEKEQKKVIDDLKGTTDKGEWKAQDFGATGGSNKLEIQVYGNNMNDIKPVTEKVQRILSDRNDLRNVGSSLSKAYQEYTLAADQEKLSKLGLTASQIGMALNDSGDQSALTTLKKDGKDVNVYVKVDKNSYKNIDDLTGKKLQSATGKEVAISDVAKVKEGETADTVTRKDDKIYASISGDVTSKNVNKVSTDVQKDIDKLDLPDGVDFKMGGVTEDINESFTQLGLAMLAAIAIVYFVLVVTFGGALAPFAILFSLPFTVIGALLALYIAGESISISAMIGALMLIGIVVTNAIVLIDRVIHKENEGLSTREALLEAAATRLRPILMTALATIGALIPLALGFEGGGLISKGLGVTVIGGLTSSTLLTLIIVPVVYEFLMKLTRKNRKRKTAE